MWHSIKISKHFIKLVCGVHFRFEVRLKTHNNYQKMVTSHCWHHDVGDLMLVTICGCWRFRCSWHLMNFGKTVTNILYSCHYTSYVVVINIFGLQHSSPETYFVHLARHCQCLRLVRIWIGVECTNVVITPQKADQNPTRRNHYTFHHYSDHNSGKC